MAGRIFGATSLTEADSNSLQKVHVDPAVTLEDGDGCEVHSGGKKYHYLYDADSGLSESIPEVVIPYGEVGDARWVFEDIYNLDSRLADKVSNSLFDANSILAADSDDTPAALVVAEGEIVGRATGGNIDGLSATQVRTIINVEDGATADQSGSEIKTAYESQADTNAFTDALLSKLNNIEASADVTDATNVANAGAVMKSLFDANTLLVANSDNTPAALTVAEQTLVGRVTGGSINDLSATQVRTLLNVENGATADQSASEILTAIKTVDGGGSGLDADTVDGYHGTNLNHLTSGASTDDPNSAVYAVMLTNHANSPDSSYYWHIITTFYSTISSTANRSQIAVRYNAASGASYMFSRYCYSNTWSAWAPGGIPVQASAPDLCDNALWIDT